MNPEAGSGSNSSADWKTAVAVLAVAVIGLVAWLVIDNQRDRSEDRSQAIAVAQTQMKDLGDHDGPVDGVSGAATEEAVNRVQAECVASLAPGLSAVPCQGVIYDVGIPKECFAKSCGLIVDFHPSGLTGEQTDAYTNLKALGNAAGYVVVQPNGPLWSIATDLHRRFLDALIGALDIDASRVHVGGASLGGFQTWHFICDHADLIASAAPHASGTGNSPGESCDFDEDRSPAGQVDILMLHGRRDSTVAFARGTAQLELVTESWGMTASEVLAEEPAYQWTRWTNEQGTVVEFVEFDWVSPTGNGHCYPGGVGSGGCGIDTPIHYGKAALDFYITHPKDG